jgi:hypothetical protein
MICIQLALRDRELSRWIVLMMRYSAIADVMDWTMSTSALSVAGGFPSNCIPAVSEATADTGVEILIDAPYRKHSKKPQMVGCQQFWRKNTMTLALYSSEELSVTLFAQEQNVQG